MPAVCEDRWYIIFKTMLLITNIITI